MQATFGKFFFPAHCCVCLAKPEKAIKIIGYGAQNSTIKIDVPVCGKCARKYHAMNIILIFFTFLLLGAGFLTGYLLVRQHPDGKYAVGGMLALVGLVIGRIFHGSIRGAFPVKADGRGELIFKNKDYIDIYERYNECEEIKKQKVEYSELFLKTAVSRIKGD